MRVLVTGSRTWEDADTIADALMRVYKERGPFTLVSGACPRGADRIAEQIVEDWGISGMDIERHPAEWDRLGKAAGFIRNAEMVHSGVDLCLAFIRNHSSGASHCAGVASRHGVPVRRYVAP